MEEECRSVMEYQDAVLNTSILSSEQESTLLQTMINNKNLTIFSIASYASVMSCPGATESSRISSCT